MDLYKESLLYISVIWEAHIIHIHTLEYSLLQIKIETLFIFTDLSPNGRLQIKIKINR